MRGGDPDGIDTLNWHTKQVDSSVIESYLGDANGGTVRFLLRVNSTDEVRVIDEQIYIEQPEKSNGVNAGLHGLSFQGGGATAAFILGNGTKYDWVPHPWDWIYMRNYPNHGLLKKNRLIALERDNWTCVKCGQPGKMAYHLDGDKGNHDVDNLECRCSKCLPKRNRVSLFKRLYGKSRLSIALYLNKTPASVYYLHQRGRLKMLLADRDEMVKKSL